MKFNGAIIENSELVDVDLSGIDFSSTTFKNTIINGVKHETPESGETEETEGTEEPEGAEGTEGTEEHGGITMIMDSQLQQEDGH